MHMLKLFQSVETPPEVLNEQVLGYWPPAAVQTCQLDLGTGTHGQKCQCCSLCNLMAHPANRIRSRTSTKCGEVNRPVL